MSAVLVLGLAAGCAAEEPADVPPVTEQSSTSAEPEVLPGPADGVEMTVAEGLELTPEERAAAEEAVEALRAALNFEDAALRNGGVPPGDPRDVYSGEALAEFELFSRTYQEEGYKRTGQLSYEFLRLEGISSDVDNDVSVRASYCFDMSDLLVLDELDSEVDAGESGDEVYAEVSLTSARGAWKLTEIVEMSDACQ
ncbi:hypothetical protein [Sediminivirga luteola]|uniref:Uncharacterized protein n=1 Tax=Sediminivirga luteola TaxID=1774748 RepID=A0A8J2TYY0_9MICO|nr:hypothetical protein [Sediminivirga luteola]GGA17806.1 hypothetical protein GCM10011333_21170 [Sediminivirga luteola]